MSPFISPTRVQNLQILTLTKSAGIALAAAFFIHYRSLAALRTEVTDLHGMSVAIRVMPIPIGSFLFWYRRAVFLAQILIQNLTNTIRQ